MKIAITIARTTIISITITQQHGNNSKVANSNSINIIKNAVRTIYEQQQHEEQQQHGNKYKKIQKRRKDQPRGRQQKVQS